MIVTVDSEQTDAVALATELTIAWLANPNTRTSADDVPAFLQTMHQAVTALTAQAAPEVEEAPPEDYVPAVSVRKSLANPEHILSMIDGKPYATLKRHLGAHGLTPDEYRRRYNLKSDYPMVAPAYSAARRATALKLGLGRKPAVAAIEMVATTAAKKVRRSGKAALAAAKAALGTTG